MWLLKKLFKKRDEMTGDGDIVKPFLDHLEDLRWTLAKMIGTLGTTMLVAFACRKPLASLLVRPLEIAVPGSKLITIDPIGSVSLSFTLAFYSGIVVSFPILFYFLAEFLLPALTKKEKKYVLPAVGVGFGLFLTGVGLCYLYVLPTTLKWLYNDALVVGSSASWTANNYYGFITHLCIAVGLVMELPVVMVTLSGIGLISYAWLKGMRIYGYAIALVLAGIISPTPDLFMLFIFALPIMVLFEACIWLVWAIEKRRVKAEAIAEAEYQREYGHPVVPEHHDTYHDDPSHHTGEHHPDDYHAGEYDAHGHHIGEDPSGGSPATLTHAGEGHTDESHAAEAVPGERPALENPSAESPAAVSQPGEGRTGEPPTEPPPAAEQPPKTATDEPKA